MYTYSYLTGSLVASPFWIGIYFARPDLRHAMLRLSLIGGAAGWIFDLLYIRDWWKPVTLTGAEIGIEAFILGFFHCGVVAVCNEVLFRRTFFHREVRPRWSIRFLYIALFAYVMFLVINVGLSFHTGVATLLVYGGLVAYMLWVRPDLARDALVGAVCSAGLGLLFFGLPEWLWPGWIEATWRLDQLSGYFIWYLPLDDFVWFLLVGAICAPTFKFSSNLVACSWKQA